MRTTITWTLIALGLTGTARAQTVLFEAYGQGFDDRLGSALAGGFDLNRDGWDDVVVGSPYADVGGLVDNGSIEVISGRTGAVLHKLAGDHSDDHFGWSVANAGDLDADGWVDLIAGAPNGWNGSARTGMARVVSGRKWKTLFTLYGDNPGDEFGYAVSGKLDWLADGQLDFAVGAPGADVNPATLPPRTGFVRVFSGASAAVLDFSYVASALARYGQALCSEGDLDADGVNDLAVGAPDVGAYGGFFVWNGATGNALFFDYGSSSQDRLGESLASSADIDGDGGDELFVGAPGADTGGADAGSALMYSGLTGALLHTWHADTPGALFGTALAVGGDLDGDGRRDLAVGAPGNPSLSPGSVSVFGTASHAELLRLLGEPQSGYGSVVARAGDFDQDGTKDLVVGGPTAVDPATPANAAPGLVRVLALEGPGFESYCTPGTSSSGCQAVLSASGWPSATAPSGFALSASGVEGSKNGLFFFGASGRQAQPWGNGSSFQCVVPPVKRGGLLLGVGTNGACDGVFTQDLNAHWCPTCPKPNHNLGAGAVVQLQLWYRDPQSTSNQATSLSDALEFLLAL